MSEDRLLRYFRRDPLYWCEEQKRALEIACGMAGVTMNVNAAWHWKHQRGPAFEAWLTVPRSKRKILLQEATP